MEIVVRYRIFILQYILRVNVVRGTQASAVLAPHWSAHLPHALLKELYNILLAFALGSIYNHSFT